MTPLRTLRRRSPHTATRTGGAEFGQRQRAASFGAVAAALALVGVQSADYARGIIGILGIAILAVLALRSRRLMLTFGLAWLVMLGFTRRLLIPFVGWAQNDPLLLVSPAAAVLLLLAMRHERAPRTLLGSAVLFHLMWAVASIANPNETSVLAAAQASLFFVTPLLWFLVGRKLTTSEHDLVLRVVLWSAVPVIGLGLWHTFRGLLPFELTWLTVANVPPSLIYVRGFNIRPFSTMTSPQEYGVILMLIGITVWAMLLRRVGPRKWLVALFVLVAIALLFQGSRGIFSAFLVAVVLVTILASTNPVVPLAATAAGLALVFLVTQGLDLSVDAQAEAQREEASTFEALYRHQLEGLANPGDTTAQLHLTLYVEGIRQGLDNPLGLGPSNNRLAGSISVAGERSVEFSPENELAITASALGIPAALSLLVIYGTAFVYAFRLYRAEPTVRHLAWLGFLIAVGDQALNGRLYLTSSIIGLVMGGLATETALMRARGRSAPPTAPAATRRPTPSAAS